MEELIEPKKKKKGREPPVWDVWKDLGRETARKSQAASGGRKNMQNNDGL